MCSRIREGGFTLVELMVVFSIMGILSTMAIMNLNALSSSSENGAAELASFLKQARARAIASTSAYFIIPSNSGHVITRFGTNCSDPSPTNDPLLTLNLPTGATLGSTAWSICFTSRGLSDSNTSIVVNDLQSTNHTVEVLLGGGVRVS